MLETKFKEKVMADLKKLIGCWVLKTMERGRHGTPDLLICLGGKFVAIELKAAKGRATKLQLHTLDRINSSGGYAMVANPASWPSQFETLRLL